MELLSLTNLSNMSGLEGKITQTFKVDLKVDSKSEVGQDSEVAKSTKSVVAAIPGTACSEVRIYYLLQFGLGVGQVPAERALRRLYLLHRLAQAVDLLLLGEVALLGGVQLLGQLRPGVLQLGDLIDQVLLGVGPARHAGPQLVDLLGDLAVLLLGRLPLPVVIITVIN